MQYIIGVGSNIGFTLENINTAIQILSSNNSLQIVDRAPLYSSKALLKDDSPIEWDIYYLNTAVKIKSILKPLELLGILKSIESKMGRDLNAKVWSPRIIDLDILSYENNTLDSDKLIIPHKELLNRSFALAPLLDIEPTWKHPLYSHLNLHNTLKTLDKSEMINQEISSTIRMGIVNLSTQSFSDGGLNYNQRKHNLLEMINNGAECIDIGAESTKLNAVNKPIDDEWLLLDKFLSDFRLNIKNLKYTPLISIDTRKLAVMGKVLHKYSDIIWMINDVECNDIEEKSKLISKYNKKYVITHNLGIIDRCKYLKKENATDDICNFINEKKQILLTNGVKPENIYFDIGIGFGKKQETAKYLLDNILVLKDRLKLKTLVGHSRKPSVLNTPADAAVYELDIATKQLSKKLINIGVDIIRIHKI